MSKGQGGFKAVLIDYVNYRGERGIRRVEPQGVYWGSNEYHPEPQWLMSAWDVEKQADRNFAMKDILSWRPL